MQRTKIGLHVAGIVLDTVLRTAILGCVFGGVILGRPSARSLLALLCLVAWSLHCPGRRRSLRIDPVKRGAVSVCGDGVQRLAGPRRAKLDGPIDRRRQLKSNTPSKGFDACFCPSAKKLLCLSLYGFSHGIPIGRVKICASSWCVILMHHRCGGATTPVSSRWCGERPSVCPIGCGRV